MLDKQEKLKSELFLAVRNGRFNEVKTLLEQIDLPYLKNCQDDYAFLLDSFKFDHFAISKLLLQYGFSVNSESRELSDTPLHFAVGHGDITIIQILLSKGANINAKTECGISPLYVAVDKWFLEVNLQWLEVIKILIKSGASVNECCATCLQRDGCSPLHRAAERNDKEFIKLFLKSNNCIDDKEQIHGRTALHTAAEHGSTAIVQLLLEHNAKINPRDKDGWTPLHLATIDGLKAVLMVLLKRGADVNSKDTKGFTPLHYAVRESNFDNECFVKLLLDHKADPNSRDSFGESPLHLAASYDDEQAIRYLLEFGADLHSRNPDGKTPLHLAAYYDRINSTRYLLEYGDDPNYRSFDGKTPLHLAALNGCEYASRYLLEYGADINLTDNKERVPLDYAIEFVESKNTISTIKNHILKLKAADLYICERNEQLLRPNCNLEHSKYIEEINVMKVKFINNTKVSFYDILVKDENKMAILLNNKDVFRALESETYKSEFPSYSSMIKLQFKKEIRRNEFRENSINFLILFMIILKCCQFMRR